MNSRIRHTLRSAILTALASDCEGCRNLGEIVRRTLTSDASDASGAPSRKRGPKPLGTLDTPEDRRITRAIEQFSRAGLSIREITNAVNQAGITTRSGHQFHPTTVARIIRRTTGRTER